MNEEIMKTIGELRKEYTIRYLSYLVDMRNKSDKDFEYFVNWIPKQFRYWAKETRNISWESEFDKPRFGDDDYKEFEHWLDVKYLNNDMMKIEIPSRRY